MGFVFDNHSNILTHERLNKRLGGCYFYLLKLIHFLIKYEILPQILIWLGPGGVEAFGERRPVAGASNPKPR